MRRATGFTLLEVLVVLVLLSIFTISTWRALDAVLSAEARARDELARWQGLAKTFARLESDLENTQSVPLRQTGVTDSSAFFGGDRAFRLTRTRQDGQLEPVEYAFDAPRLTRKTAQAAPLVVAQIHGALRFQYLDAQGRWQPAWPPVEGGRGSTELPAAIELVFNLREGQSLRRVFRVQ